MENIGKNKVKENLNKKRRKPNIFSRLFFLWICPLFIKGNRRDILEDDLVNASNNYESKTRGEHLERYWFEELAKAEINNRQPLLWKALLRAYWLSYMPSGVYVLLVSIARMVQPLVFANLLEYWTEDSSISRKEAGLYALGMLTIHFVGIMGYHHNNIFMNRFSMKVKVACSSILYRKLLRMSQVSVNEAAAGKLLNLLSNDINRFDYAFLLLHYLWIVPIQAGVVLYILYLSAGYAPFVGLFAVVIIIFPFQAGLTKFTAFIRRQSSQRTDDRIKLMSEIVKGIKVIKMYAWEKSFLTIVKAARASEIRALSKALFVRCLFLAFMLFTEKTTLFLTILTFTLTGNMITATMIYPLQQFFSIIQMNLTLIFPVAISSLTEMLVSLERIQNFISLDDQSDSRIVPRKNLQRNIFNSNEKNKYQNTVWAQKYALKDIEKPIATVNLTVTSKFVIELHNLSASWTLLAKPEEITLKNISLRIQKGKLCAVIGPVGSGKTSLLQLLLRELPITTGSLNVKGKLSFACQEAWVFSATVRDNIVFGLPYIVEKYKEVCKVCCLEPDFKQLPYGDLTLVGERGVAISGGQRARINLARAIYREADIYLLDDPLSAVDANVGRLLFEGCIKGYLKSRTCILVTHQIQYLKAVDYIVVLNEGRIENVGTYEELVQSGSVFTAILSSASSAEPIASENLKNKQVNLRGMPKDLSDVNSDENEERAQIMQTEERNTGSLKLNVISKYLTSVKSWCSVILTVLMLIITQVAVSVADYWLSFWTNQIQKYEQSLPEGEDLDTSLHALVGPLTTAQYLTVYGCVILAIIILSQLRILTFVVATMKASENLHNNVYEKLIVTAMRFFYTNSSGRILNRFSKDMGAMDEQLPRSMLETIQMYLFMSSMLVLNAIALPWTLIPTIVLLLSFFAYLKWYLNAAQAVKRLESTTKSPVFGLINATISGLTTIRSSDSQMKFLRLFDDAQDLHTSAVYTFVGACTAFSFNLDILCLIYLGAIIATFLFIDFGAIISVGSVGLAVSQSMSLTVMLQMAARYTTDFLSQMTAVERILEYTDLPAEEHLEIGPTVPPKEWPCTGNISFEKVYFKYAVEDPSVLKNVSFNIKSGWKVGIVGRTGAGKSTLISALFRLSNVEGSIKIDGLDTKDIAKKDLRSSISIIPQEPVLFSATVRYNLDPFNSYSDDDIWRALEQVELKEAIPALDYKVSEGGSNFSMGQRQLVCLARAILRSNRILIMDEATANVDPQTDALIQRTIRRQFETCTVLTIAHRLNTIMDSDRVLVMDNGEVVEFDHPHILLSDPYSVFSFMVKETGEKLSIALRNIAKSKYESDYKEV